MKLRTVHSTVLFKKLKIKKKKREEKKKILLILSCPRHTEINKKGNKTSIEPKINAKVDFLVFTCDGIIKFNITDIIKFNHI